MKNVEYSAYATIPQTHVISVYSCGKKAEKPGQVSAAKLQMQYRLCYVVSGKGVFRTNNISHKVSQGQGFLLSPDQLVSLEADKVTPWEYLWVDFDGTEACKIAQSMGFSEKNPLYEGDSDCDVKDLLEGLIALFEQDQNNKYGILAIFYSLVSYLQQNNENGKQSEKGHIEKALDYIHHNFTYRIKIEDIARYVDLDRTYLFKLFVKNVGTAPQEYLIRYRLEHAARLLTETKLSTAQIADSCGFRDAPSFCKHFKARYNVSPLAFRKDKKGQQ